MAEGIETFHSKRIITIGKVIEGNVLFCCPGAPSSVVELITVVGHIDNGDIVECVGEVDVSLLAVQYHFFWYGSESSPEDGVASKADGADVYHRLHQEGRILHIGVDDREALVVTQPQLMTVVE